MEKDGGNFENLLSNIYENPRLNASFSGVKNLYHAAKLINKNIKIKDVKDYLTRNSTYVDYKQVKRNGKRRKFVSYFNGQIWGLDLCFLRSELTHFNRGYGILCVCVDFFSRFLRVIPLKNKKAETTRKAVEQMIADNAGAPYQIHW